MSQLDSQDQNRTPRSPWLAAALIVVLMALGFVVMLLTRDISSGASYLVGAATGVAAVWTYRATRKR